MTKNDSELKGFAGQYDCQLEATVVGTILKMLVKTVQLLVNTFPFLMVKDIVQIEVHDLYYEQKRTVISAL